MMKGEGDMKVREQPSPELRARFLAAAARTPATRPASWKRRAVGAVAAAVALALVAAIVMRVRADWGELPAGSLIQTFMALLGVATAAGVVALQRGRSMIGAGTEHLVGIGAAGLVLLVALVATVDPQGATTRLFSGEAEYLHAFRCDLIVVGLGLVLLAVGLIPLGGLTPGRPGLTGACLGLAAATLAHAVVRFHCGVGGTTHALLGHLLPALPLMAIGAWAVRAGGLSGIAGRWRRRREQKS